MWIVPIVFGFSGLVPIFEFKNYNNLLIFTYTVYPHFSRDPISLFLKHCDKAIYLTLDKVSWKQFLSYPKQIVLAFLYWSYCHLSARETERETAIQVSMDSSHCYHQSLLLSVFTISPVPPKKNYSLLIFKTRVLSHYKQLPARVVYMVLSGLLIN